MLVIDDEPLLLSALQRLLSLTNRVDVTTSAEDAVERLLRGERYDIILCDVLMPEMTGVDFFDEVARRLPAQALRIVFVTGGVTDPALRERLHESGAPVLEKPVEFRVLQDLADEYADAQEPRAAASE